MQIKEGKRLMLAKACAAAFCLTALVVMTVSSLWATPSYSVSTRINSLGTTLNSATGAYEAIVGGSIKTRTLGADGAEVLSHNQGTRYTTVPTTKQVEVEVEPADGYKIASLMKTSYEVVDGVIMLGPTLPVALDSKDLHTETFVDLSNPLLKGKTQFLVATFAIDSAGPVISKTWQLQVQNNNGGGWITVTRGASSDQYLPVGKPLIKNYMDTTPVTVTATPKVGFVIDYIVINGVKDSTDRAIPFSLAAAESRRLYTFNVGYKKSPISVTTHSQTYLDTVTGETKFINNGILPINPVSDPYGVVRLIVAPTAAKNRVTGISVHYLDDDENPANDAAYPASNIVLTDRFGDPVTLPYTGVVKVIINGLTKAVRVSASYSFDATSTAAARNCTNTCHLDAGVPQRVRDAASEWSSSPHARHPNRALDCVYCHKSMPGEQLTAFTCTRCHMDLYAPNLSLRHNTVEGACLTCHNQHSTAAVVTR